MARVYNFSAGPSMLPQAVLEQAQSELLDFQGSGMSVMEMSHRGRYFSEIAQALEQDLRDIMRIPTNYRMLFLQGGASAQFSFIPQNLLGEKTTACYVNTGAWSQKAMQDAQHYCEVVVSASAEEMNFTCIPHSSLWHIDPNAAYLHYTSNETIHGVEFNAVPDAQGLPLVCDMSSNILSRHIDVADFGLIYAGSQKNMGPAGVTLVIVREDLLGKCANTVPALFNYSEQVKNQSMLNTPNTYSWYLMGLVLKWVQAQGGIEALEQRNIAKAATLYEAIDASSLYHNPVDKTCRSRMNVPFVLVDETLDSLFLKEAQANGLQELKGHRMVGGMRASIYNAMPESGIEALIHFMQEFERTH
ncbi:MAG TPA: 3-phosphoserine/phosphohydroxythreonine transaminase [Methylococcaceae bacterium]|nr:3-phosphoserine/phosphohydroxythreonine transaminase [Methylococcaceae bacterium]